MRGDLLPHHTADRAFDVQFNILGVGADVADVGKGERDDLRGVGGIGHHLLVAGHRGVEANLAHSLADRTEAFAPDDPAVGQYQYTGRSLRLRRRLGGGHGALRVSVSGDVAKSQRLGPVPCSVKAR